MTPSLQSSSCDILLIQPPIRDFYLTRKRTIPYGLACIAAYLAEARFSVRILDALATSKSRIIDLPPEMSYVKPYYGKADKSAFTLFHHYRHFGYSFEFIGQQVRKMQPFVVGISSLFSAYAKEAVKTAEIVKANHPDSVVVMGGHHPTALPERVMESAAVDFVIRGEGEESIILLANALRSGTAYGDIPGLVYRKSDGSLQTAKPAFMRDPDKIPAPAIHLFNQRYYSRNKKCSTVIVASRGCPLKCSYCSIGASSPMVHRRRSVKSVIREIEKARDGYEIGFIDFEDENLSLDRNWFLHLLKEIKHLFKDNPVELRAMNGLLPSSLDKEVIVAMKAAGFRILNLSLGTTSLSQLKRFRRPDVRRAFEHALHTAQTCGLQTVGYIIVGAPFQKADDSLKDLLYLAERRVLAGTSVFYPAPGSPDYALCASMGLLPEKLSCMRSSALPLSHITTRRESVTLLRLSRIINFIKSIVDSGHKIPRPAPAVRSIEASNDRREVGRQLLQFFLYDGIIRGLSPDGEVFEHEIDQVLSNQFLKALESIQIRGYK